MGDKENTLGSEATQEAFDYSSIKKAFDNKPNITQVTNALIKDFLAHARELPKVKVQCAKYEERLKFLIPNDYLASAIAAIAFTLLGVSIPCFLSNNSKGGWLFLLGFVIFLSFWGVYKWLINKNALDFSKD